MVVRSDASSSSEADRHTGLGIRAPGCGARCGHGLLREAPGHLLLRSVGEDLRRGRCRSIQRACDSVRPRGAGVADRVGASEIREHSCVVLL